MSKRIVLTGAVFVVLAIILGAMAAHKLEELIQPKLLDTFEKGVKYQMYIGLGLLAIGTNAEKFNFKLTSFFALNVIGVFLFSGMIYCYSLHELIPSMRPLAIVIPFGGVAMIVGWVIFIIQLLKKRN